MSEKYLLRVPEFTPNIPTSIPELSRNIEWFNPTHSSAFEDFGCNPLTGTLKQAGYNPALCARWLKSPDFQVECFDKILCKRLKEICLSWFQPSKRESWKFVKTKLPVVVIEFAIWFNPSERKTSNSWRTKSPRIEKTIRKTTNMFETTQ